MCNKCCNLFYFFAHEITPLNTYFTASILWNEEACDLNWTNWIKNEHAQINNCAIDEIDVHFKQRANDGQVMSVQYTEWVQCADADTTPVKHGVASRVPCFLWHRVWVSHHDDTQKPRHGWTCAGCNAVGGGLRYCSRLTINHRW